jgi:hypothetical protein
MLHRQLQLDRLTKFMFGRAVEGADFGGLLMPNFQLPAGLSVFALDSGANNQRPHSPYIIYSLAGSV